MLRFLSAAAWLIGAGFTPSAQAWGADGHRLIAELAEARLSRDARAEIERLLAAEQGASLISISTWADEIRVPASARLHYLNTPPGPCSYERQRDCADGRCVVEAIERNVAVLRTKASDAERLVALKYVVHLIGDVHQPLHLGMREDKGGNLAQVQAFGRGSNLHKVWDSELIRHRAGGLSKLRSDAGQATLARDDGTSTNWAMESCQVAREADFYPAIRVVDGDYAARWDAVLVRAISRAGSRLARVLNEALNK